MLASWCCSTSHQLLGWSSRSSVSQALSSYLNCSFLENICQTSPLCFSVPTEWGWHCSVLCVLRFLSWSAPWAVKNSATHSPELTSSSERQGPRASGKTSLAKITREAPGNGSPSKLAK